MKPPKISNIFTSIAMTTFVLASAIQPATASVPFADPTPANPPTVTNTPDIAKNPEALKEIIGKQGARMGQGMTRIKENKTPQTPTPEAPAPTPITDTTTPAKTAAITSQSSTLSISTVSMVTTMVPAAVVTSPSGVQGLDVSGWQSNVDWTAQKNMGARFAYVKATEGTTYTSSSFGSQYNGAYTAGLIRGAYHFAIPSVSSGAVQADYFINHGGGWSADGKTMPPLLDIEYNPYPSLGNTCYNMSATDMVSWIRDFSNRMKTRTGRVPAIYTTTDWWKTCTGNSAAFGANPLHVASYSTAVGSLPASWPFYSLWQYSSTGPFAGDSNVWNGTEASLRSFAANVALPVTSAPVATPMTPLATRAATLKSVLGAPTSKEITGLKNGGSYQTFQNATMYWSPATGAHFIRGAIKGKFILSGSEKGSLGYPTSDEITGLKNGGARQTFQGGAIYWSPATGAHISVGGIRGAWSTAGYENGSLGYPTSDEIYGLRNGGVYQTYEHGNIIYAPGVGAFISRGGIRNAWIATGGVNGRLGYPTSNEYAAGNGVTAQNYQGGKITWTSTRGTAVTYK